MLSIETPPPDPSCSCQFPQLKSGSDEIEKASLKLPLPEVDLLKQPSLGRHHHHQHHTPLPKFSIRDYVFTARSKDIKKNWPFSSKNLQLCLKHGVKDPLPPFQSLDSVKNQSLLLTCAADETTLPEKQNTSEKLDGQPSGSNDNRPVVESSHDAQSIHHLAVACIENSSCRSEGENENTNENDFPSTTTSISQSEINSVPTNKKPSNLPLLEPDTSVEASAEVQAAGPCKSKKTENASRPSGKKCRLIVKFGANSDRSSTEDIASNCTTVSESMASKVCPVCKTFSSSSNTTLNAHIDQCLSAESTPKWTVDSKLNRHRIKPRKTKLMVDIYATALPCTLEELDRRNGTSWASISNLTSLDTEKLEASDEGKKQRVGPVHPEDSGDVGAVYIDANGTKLRILSKFDDVPPRSKVGEDLGPNKSFKGVKGSKSFSTKKKRRHLTSHHKFMKHAPESRKIFSPKAHVFKTVGVREGYCREEEGSNKEERHIQKQIKSSDSGNLLRRICSKRTGFARKSNIQDSHQPLVCKWHVTRDLPVQSDLSSLGGSVAERNCVQKTKNLPENPVSSPENTEKKQKPVYEVWAIDKGEHSSGRKRLRSPMFGARIDKKFERSFPPLKQNAKQLSEDSSYTRESHISRHLSSTGNCGSSLSNKAVGIDAINKFGNPPSSGTKPSSSHALTSKSLRFSSLKKKVLSVNSRLPDIEPSSNLVKKFSTAKKSRLHFSVEIDREAMACEPEVDEEYELHDQTRNQHGREMITEEPSFSRGSIQGVIEQRGSVRRDEIMALKSSDQTPNFYDHDEGENADSSVRADDIMDRVDGTESTDRTVTTVSKSAEAKFREPSVPSKIRSNSLKTIEEYNGPLCGGEALAGPTGSSFGDRQDMFCTEEDDGLIGQNSHMGPDLDSEVAQGGSFLEVDPIPIPGPPGSFLPSPRDMGSDDFQGNSSLTSSRVQSSQDQLDLVDGDSSDSPISAASTISNPTTDSCDLKYSEPLLSVAAPAIQEKNRSGFSNYDTESSAENTATVPQTSSGLDRNFDGEKIRVQRISVEKRPFVFKNDDQPCCCQRKEKSSQGIALSYQQSQLFRRRTMASVTVPATELQMGANSNMRPNNFDVRPDVFSLSSSTSLGSEKLVLPVLKPPACLIPLNGCPDAGVKFSGRGDCDSASPSASNPVLRLMGKNLMVVNKEEDATIPLGQSQPCSQSNRLASQFPTPSGISPGNIRNQDGQCFHHSSVPQDTLIFSQNPNDVMGQSFDVRLSNSIRNRASLVIPQRPPQIRAGMFSDQRLDRGFAASMEPYNFEGDYNIPTRQNRPKNKLGPAATLNMEKVTTRSLDSVVPVKEIIVIDDAPESETNMTNDNMKRYEVLRDTQLMSSGISTPTVTNHNLSFGNHFSCYQSQESSLLGQPPAVQNTPSHAVPSRRTNSSPVRWGCTSEGPGVMLQRSPFMAALPSTTHLRSTMYYSPSLS